MGKEAELMTALDMLCWFSLLFSFWWHWFWYVYYREEVDDDG